MIKAFKLDLKMDLWLSQKAIGELYNCSIDNVSLLLKNIYNDFELDKNSNSK